MNDIVTGIPEQYRHFTVKLRELYRELYSMYEVATGEIINATIYHGHRYRPIAVKEHVSLYRKGPDINVKRRI